MLLSVVVPVYRAEEWLDACVASVLGQTHRDLELILVDDGSPDGSGALCDAWAGRDPRVKVLHKANGGVSSARNAGIAAAQGKYVGFVDSDDTIAPETYAACIAAAEEHGCDQVSFGYNIVRGGAAEPHTMPAFFADSPEALRPHFMEYVSKASIFGSACNKLYLRAMLAENGIRFDETIRQNEDEAFNFTALAHTRRLLYMNQCYYNYMMRDNESATRAGAVNVYEAALAAEKYADAYFDAVPELADLREDYLEGRRRRALFNHFSQLTGRNALGFSQRRAALRAITGDEARRDTLVRRLQGEGGGSGLARLCLKWRAPGLLAAVTTLRNKLT